MKQKIGIIGHGHVGKALRRIVAGLADIELVGIAVKHPQKHREIGKGLLRPNALDMIRQPEIGIILEAIDREDDALSYAEETLKLGKVYITANKKMVANNYVKLQKLANDYNGQILFEAAVGGAIPIVRIIQTVLKNQEITKIRGILNGTCNYILSEMFTNGSTYKAALTNAQYFGYAESNPRSDVDGQDAYFKAYILVSILANGKADLSRLKFSGISDLTEEEVLKAKRKNEKIKLIVEIEKQPDSFTIVIGPKTINDRDSLFTIENELNAVEIEGPNFQKLVLIGPGAGGKPTASAMVSDLLNVRTQFSENSSPGFHANKPLWDNITPKNSKNLKPVKFKHKIQKV